MNKIENNLPRSKTIFSNRTIHVDFRFDAKEEFLLGENYLGYDTKIEAVAV